MFVCVLDMLACIGFLSRTDACNVHAHNYTYIFICILHTYICIYIYVSSSLSGHANTTTCFLPQTWSSPNNRPSCMRPAVRTCPLHGSLWVFPVGRQVRRQTATSERASTREAREKQANKLQEGSSRQAQAETSGQTSEETGGKTSGETPRQGPSEQAQARRRVGRQTMWETNGQP